MLLADTHLLGPFRGHWLDKLRREWQMHRSFQAAVTIFSPEHIFFLGDLFDEGSWVNPQQYRQYVDRFRRLFATPASIQTHAVVGNHDIGFHYATLPVLINRFYSTFNTSGVRIITIRDIHFVTINSVAMERDGCILCEEAERELINISYQLDCARGKGTAKSCAKIPKIENYSPPIVLQHFPMYRKSDAECIETSLPKLEQYKEQWDVLSRDSTTQIARLLEPRVAFSGHTHYYCYLRNRILKADEYTIPSFSCRNLDGPSFLLAEFTRESYKVSKCDLPKESTVLYFYGVGVISSFILPFFFLRAFY